MADEDKLIDDDEDEPFVAWGLGWAFWIQWVLASAVGWSLGPMVQQALIEASGTSRSQLALGIGLGLMLGLAHWLIFLPQPYQVGIWWVLVSIIGWGIGWPLGWSLGWQIFGSLGFGVIHGVIGLIGGAGAGLGQWLILRSQVHRAGWWIAISALGWGLALGFTFTFFRSQANTLTGVIAALLTGGPLIWLLRQPVDDSLRAWIEASEQG